jgi:hypothetical protein
MHSATSAKPTTTPTDTYHQINIWRTGWTTDTAHYLIRIATSHGRVRHTMMKAVCGQNINPGWLIDPTNVREGVTLCSSCQAKLATKAKAAKAVTEKVACADCGDGRASKTSAYCSICRPYHPHTLTKADAATRAIWATNDRPTNLCGTCGYAADHDLHRLVQA